VQFDKPKVETGSDAITEESIVESESGTQFSPSYSTKSRGSKMRKSSRRGTDVGQSPRKSKKSTISGDMTEQV
jgi:hypothetical protein